MKHVVFRECGYPGQGECPNQFQFQDRTLCQHTHADCSYRGCRTYVSVERERKGLYRLLAADSMLHTLYGLGRMFTKHNRTE